MRKNLMNERWQRIEGFPGYEISDYGRVWSYRKGRILKAQINDGGYVHISLLDEHHTAKAVLIHRLVALHFVPNPYDDPQVNHMDGLKTNNHFSNLEWCTARQNTHHAMNLGLRPGTPKEEIIDDEDWYWAR